MQRAVVEARQAAEAAADAKFAPQIVAYESTAAEIANVPRCVGKTPVPRPERPDVDLTAMRKAQEALDRLGAEIRACRRRQEATAATVDTTLTTLAEQLAQLLWIGPGGDSYRPDWSELY